MTAVKPVKEMNERELIAYERWLAKQELAVRDRQWYFEMKRLRKVTVK